jgi:hypothetical protein
MKKRLITILMSTVFAVALTSNANAGQPSVYIISPAQGQVVSSPVQVRFGLRGMGVAPAGVDKDKTGHHHLLIDVDVLPNLTVPVPADKNHRHFGAGQTEVELILEPGEHSLQLLLGDKFHIPHAPALVSEKITITVEQ